jgi:thymidylate synthase
MKSYIDLVNYVYDNGTYRFNERTKCETLSAFGVFFEVDLRKGFPLLTTKKLSTDLIFSELEWFINGRTDLRWLLENNNHIWTGDAFKKFGPGYEKYLNLDPGSLTPNDFELGVKRKNPLEKNIYGKSYYFTNGCNLGPIYGAQWRGTYHENAPDQLAEIVLGLIEDPFSRRHIISSWNSIELKNMTLPPCHFVMQFYVREGPKGKVLDLMWTQRSADLALGIPFNIASYALLLHLIAKEVDMLPGFLKCSIGDAHIYEPHLLPLLKQIELEPLQLPEIDISETSLWEFDYKKVKVENYNCNPRISYQLFN